MVTLTEATGDQIREELAHRLQEGIRTSHEKMRHVESIVDLLDTLGNAPKPSPKPASASKPGPKPGPKPTTPASQPKKRVRNRSKAAAAAAPPAEAPATAGG